jgi:small-conductance mechanosensitive channel
MNIDAIRDYIESLSRKLLDLMVNPQFYSQIAIIIIAIFSAYFLSNIIKRHTPVFKEEPKPGRLLPLRQTIYAGVDLLFPIINILFLAIAADLSTDLIQQAWAVRIAESLAVVIALYLIITRFIKKRIFKNIVKWIIIPIALLQVFGWLDNVATFMDNLDLELGNIRISAYGVVRLIFFGIILFWIGRVFNNIGQQIIRNQDELEIGTREVAAKLFQVVLFLIIFIMLLQVLGINLTALAVFGGALGVGLGFGLQSIAANFISGIIILLDRSVAVGDYIQLEDGSTGVIRELNMRSAILETYDGKDIMVPNEQFITSNFINWTHKNKKQRYPIEFSVAYDTDLDLLFEVVRKVVASHPKVLSRGDLPIEEKPDVEIASFGDSGINILVEFWMEGIDDGVNRVGADLLYMIWKELKKHNIQIPFPQREVRILNPK